MNRATSLSTLALLVLATVGCNESSPTQPLASPRDATFAKQATTSSRMLYYDFYNVWIMNDDGTGATALTITADGAYDPSWAPDGKRILFNAYRGEPEASIYIMNDDGSAVTRITRPPAGAIDTRPTRFGKGVAFVRWNLSTGAEDVYRVNLDGSGETLIAAGRNPAASPSGDRLAYVSGDDIWEYVVATGVSTNLTNTPSIAESDPSYSPNGKMIAFAASSTAGSGIYVMQPDGSAITRLAWSDVGNHMLPKWSPDGKRLAFSRSESTNYAAQDVYVMNADGSGATNITNSPVSSDMLTAWAR